MPFGCFQYRHSLFPPLHDYASELVEVLVILTIPVISNLKWWVIQLTIHSVVMYLIDRL